MCAVALPEKAECLHLVSGRSACASSPWDPPAVPWKARVKFQPRQTQQHIRCQLPVRRIKKVEKVKHFAS